MCLVSSFKIQATTSSTANEHVETKLIQPAGTVYNGRRSNHLCARLAAWHARCKYVIHIYSMFDVGSVTHRVRVIFTRVSKSRRQRIHVS